MRVMFISAARRRFLPWSSLRHAKSYQLVTSSHTSPRFHPTLSICLTSKNKTRATRTKTAIKEPRYAAPTPARALQLSFSQQKVRGQRFPDAVLQLTMHTNAIHPCVVCLVPYSAAIALSVARSLHARTSAASHLNAVVISVAFNFTALLDDCALGLDAVGRIGAERVEFVQ